MVSASSTTSWRADPPAVGLSESTLTQLDADSAIRLSPRTQWSARFLPKVDSWGLVSGGRHMPFCRIRSRDQATVSPHPWRLRRTAAASLAVLMSLVGVLGALSPTDAIYKICYLPSSHDDGPYQLVVAAWPATTPLAVQAQIEEYDVIYTANNGAGTNMSVMLAGSGLSRWDQIGWYEMKKYGNGTVGRYIAEEFEPGANWQYWPARPIGALTTYKLTFDPLGKVYRAFVNGTQYSSHASVSFPVSYQIMGETHDIADQMPGGLADTAQILAPQYQRVGLIGWQSVTGSMGNPRPSTFGVRNLSPGYEIWDQRCSA